MRTGTRISAIGHGAAIALAVFGLPWFGPRERETIRVTEVSFVSEADFRAAQSAAEAPREETAPATAAAGAAGDRAGAGAGPARGVGRAGARA